MPPPPRARSASRPSTPDAILRAAIAIPGAYATASLAGTALTGLLARTLALSPADAALSGMIAALILCPVCAIAGFACASARHTARLTALLCAPSCTALAIMALADHP